MSASSALLVVATIVAVDGGMATVDAGTAQHLEPGDRGQTFYELQVDGAPKRIEVGRVRVIATGDGSSSVISESRIPLRPGYRVELRLPVERLPEPGRVGEKSGQEAGEGLAPSQESGLRLPSEEEWEVAAQSPEFDTTVGIFEWTASWYQAYPGNSRREESYGEVFRVLRGSADESSDALLARRFMDPDQRHSRVGFRCVKDAD